MKTATRRMGQSVRALAILCGCILALGTAVPARAAALTYGGTGINWFDPGAWDGGATWTSGDSAAFTVNGGVVATNANSTSVAGLSKSGSTSLTIYPDGTTERILNFSGGTISGPVSVYGYVNIQGNFTQVGNRYNNEGIKSAYVGTATISSGGSIWYNNAVQVGTGSMFVVNNGELRFRNGAFNAGAVTVNSGGALRFGRDNNNVAASAVIASLNGNGGVVETAATATAPATRLFTIRQIGNTAFAGTFNGTNGSGSTLSQLQLRKEGAGDLTLSGSLNNITKETSIIGGRLYINSSITDFSSTDGTTAINVDGGTLGGTGTITVNGSDNVMLTATGKLAAGIEGAAGRTTYALNGGTLNLSAATASTNTGWLKFDLGDPTTAGVTYDQIRLTSGALNIGTGLDVDAFDIQLSPNPKSGSYILFETGAPIVGSLGTATGTIAGTSWITGTLSIDGNNLVMEVFVPPRGTLIHVR